MSAFYENFRNVLSEVDKFIESLKNEKLSKKVQTGRDKVVEAIKKLRHEFPSLESQSDLKVPDNDTDHVSNESIKTKSSHGSGNAEEDEGVYSENVPEKSVRELADPTKAGYLDKRRKKPALLQSPYQKRFCVVKDRFFYYFEKNTDKKQAGAFSLEGYEFKEAPQYVQGRDVNKKLCFELTSPGKRPFQGKATEEVNDLVFLVDSKEEFHAWQEAITGVSSVYENYEELRKPGYDSMKPAAGVEHKYMGHATVYSGDGYLQLINPPLKGKTESYYQNDAPRYENTDPKKRNSVQFKEERPALPQGPPPTKRQESPQKLPTPKKEQETPPELPPPRKEPIRLTWHPELDYENMYYGKWDHRADVDTELAFKYGEIIHVVNRDLDTSGWWIGRKGDNYGLVAKLFLAPAYTQFKGK